MQLFQSFYYLISKKLKMYNRKIFLFSIHYLQMKIKLFKKFIFFFFYHRFQFVDVTTFHTNSSTAVIFFLNKGSPKNLKIVKPFDLYQRS